MDVVPYHSRVSHLMSEKEPIRGKVDNGHHEGKRSSLRRIAETDEEVIEFWKEVWPELWNYVVNGVNSHEPLDKPKKKE